MFWNGPIDWEEIPHRREMIATVLVCLKELSWPEELETLLIRFFGPAFKIMKTEEPDGSLRWIKLIGDIDFVYEIIGGYNQEWAEEWADV